MLSKSSSKEDVDLKSIVEEGLRERADKLAKLNKIKENVKIQEKYRKVTCHDHKIPISGVIMSESQ